RASPALLLAEPLRPRRRRDVADDELDRRGLGDDLEAVDPLRVAAADPGVGEDRAMGRHLDVPRHHARADVVLEVGELHAPLEVGRVVETRHEAHVLGSTEAEGDDLPFEQGARRDAIGARRPGRRIVCVRRGRRLFAAAVDERHPPRDAQQERPPQSTMAAHESILETLAGGAMATLPAFRPPAPSVDEVRPVRTVSWNRPGAAPGGPGRLGGRGTAAVWARAWGGPTAL